ncbi:MAG: hemolysin III family protein [Hyphomicrobiales bacterium]
MTKQPMTKPILRGHFHQAMFFISLGGLAVLASLTNSNRELISILVYAFGVLSMFGISALYHRINWSSQNRALFRKLDHSAIFVMIAGTFTPVAMLGLSAESSKILLLTIWGVTILGVVKSIWLTNLPKLLNAALYVGAGYVIYPYIDELSASLGANGMYLLVAGGFIYSIGAAIYSFKKPNPYPKYFGYHEVFHLLVNVAAILHFMAVYALVAK